jgi:hypothetical protein
MRRSFGEALLAQGRLDEARDELRGAASAAEKIGRARLAQAARAALG